MKIYISHAKAFDFQSELYKPLKESGLSVDFIFPHEEGLNPYSSMELFGQKKIDMVLAEISSPATGQGIELAWAQSFGIPIVCIYKKGSDISGSLKFLTDKFVEYSDSDDMIGKLKKYIILN